MDLNIFDEFQPIVVIILTDAPLSHFLSKTASSWHLNPFDLTLIGVFNSFLAFCYDKISRHIFHFPKESWFLLVQCGI